MLKNQAWVLLLKKTGEPVMDAGLRLGLEGRREKMRILKMCGVDPKSNWPAGISPVLAGLLPRTRM